jgi:hypothetical protein
MEDIEMLPGGARRPLTVAGMFRDPRTLHRYGAWVLQEFPRLQTTTSHIGDLKALKMSIEVLSYGQSASLLCLVLDLRRQMGATTHIDTVDLDADVKFGMLCEGGFRHPRTRMAFSDDTRSLGFSVELELAF